MRGERGWQIRAEYARVIFFFIFFEQRCLVLSEVLSPASSRLCGSTLAARISALRVRLPPLPTTGSGECSLSLLVSKYPRGTRSPPVLQPLRHAIWDGLVVEISCFILFFRVGVARLSLLASSLSTLVHACLALMPRLFFCYCRAVFSNHRSVPLCCVTRTVRVVAWLPLLVRSCALRLRLAHSLLSSPTACLCAGSSE